MNKQQREALDRWITREPEWFQTPECDECDEDTDRAELERNDGICDDCAKLETEINIMGVNENDRSKDR